MHNAKIAEITALLANGALQSGKLPVDTEHVAGYYAELYQLIAKIYAEPVKTRTDSRASEVSRITKNPNDVWQDE